MKTRAHRVGAAARRARGLSAAVGCLLAAACAVGPDFKPPGPPRLDAYAAAPRRLEADGAVQTLTIGAAAPQDWWRLFGSPALDGLVDLGLKASPTLASAQAALEQSRDQARAGAGVFFPSASASATATREHANPLEVGQHGAASTFSLYTLSGDISYALDLFGGQRRGVEALQAQAEYQRQAVRAAYLTLSGGIVDTAVARAGYAEQVKVLGEIVGFEADQRDILAAQYKSGQGALSAQLAAEQQLASDRETLAHAQQRLAAAQDLLQTLIGREPAEATAPRPALDDLSLPADAPVSLPSQVARQRPDILEAEANLHQANAEVGVATAALFPSVTLTGDYGAASLALSGLGSPMGRFWSIGPAIDAPIFRGGSLWFSREAALAAHRKAAADYRQVVLAALQQVSDAINALEADTAAAAASRAAYDAAGLNLNLADANRRAGLIADLDLLGDKIEADRARLDLIAARTQRLQDVVALYVACGGGWDARAPQAGQVVGAVQ